MAPFEYLRTQRVLLRQYRDDDFDHFLELNSDPQVMKYLPEGVAHSPQDIRAGIERTLFYRKKYDGKLGVYSAERIQDGDVMGWFHLRPDRKDLENTKVLELGYRLKRKFWGQGYATEVSTALLEKAFQELQAESVFARTLALNLRSRRVMEKIGMHFEREYLDPDHPGQGAAVIYRLNNSNF